jgi:hypothetical protein
VPAIRASRLEPFRAALAKLDRPQLHDPMSSSGRRRPGEPKPRDQGAALIRPVGALEIVAIGSGPA